MVLAAIQATPDAATDDLGHQQGARPEMRGPYNCASDLALDVRARQINDIVTPSLAEPVIVRVGGECLRPTLNSLSLEVQRLEEQLV